MSRIWFTRFPTTGAIPAAGFTGIAAWMVAGLLSMMSLQAAPVLGPWVPLFKGIDHARGTNAPDASNPDRTVVNVARVDLTDPDIRLKPTPRIATGYNDGFRETGGMTVSRYLQTQKAQLAINANFFDQGQYYLPEGTPMDLGGLSIREGEVVSSQDSAVDSSVIAFDSSNRPSVIYTNWPAQSTAGVFTAVAGVYPVVVKGANVAHSYANLPGNLHDAQPRTLYGISADRRYLYLMTIDGRQPGYSVGALDYESANWMLAVGAADAINMDGGGSTTLVIENSLGLPERLNSSSAVADSGKERTVGSHLAVFAKPLAGFFSEVKVMSDDEAASISWKTDESAVSWIEYGPTADLGSKTAVPTTPGTNHSALLTGLTAGTAYTYRFVATPATGSQSSPLYAFTTTNYNAFQSLIELTNAWKFSTAAQSGTTWAGKSYNDAAWSGPSPGVLWVDVRVAGGNALIPSKSTQLQADPANAGYPFTTYYFRTHVQVASAAASRELTGEGYIDDGAVFYINGVEVSRLRMDPTADITSSTLALSYPCSGDATCADSLRLDGSLLVDGDNVIAVEVHNYNLRSADMTFGMSLQAVRSAPPAPSVTVKNTAEGLELAWDRGGFVLQQSDSPTGPWINVPGPVVMSPYVTTASASARYFRLNR